MKIYDISPEIRESIAVWPGDRKFRCQWTMQIRKGDSCNVSAVTMSVHTGSHVDAPYHFDEAGKDVASVPLKHYLGPARVVELAVDGPIAEHHLAALDWSNVERVLFKTRASDFPERRFDPGFTCFTEAAASFLGEHKLLLVGTDAPSVDAFSSKTLAVHKILLRYGVAILEGIRLAHVPAGDFELIALPLRLAGLDGSPVRAVLRRCESRQ